jgi:hypothetical protein
MSKIFALPIRPLLETAGEWEAFIGDETDPVISFKLSLRRREIVMPDKVRYEREPALIKDAFLLREHFFEVRNAEDALKFFQEYGPFQLAKQWDGTAKPIKLSQAIGRRDFYLDALINSPRTFRDDEVGAAIDDLYLWQNLPLELPFRQPMHAVVRCKDVEDALRASVFLDRLRAMPWRRCMREDCGKPFELPRRRAKIYCSPECSHLQSVRFYNKRQQSAKPTKKKAKG